MRRFENRVAVVTVAASGIGRATAMALSREGCHLALVDIKAEPLEETRTLCRADRHVSTHVVNVADKAAMQQLASDVAREHGGTHVLVNNAGVAVGASFMEQSLEDFEWLMGINFWGVVYGCKFFLPQLLEADEAHIVNISSVFGLQGVPMNSSYCASKFAVRGLSESLRTELVETRVGVTCVHPGGVATNIVKDARFVEPEGMSGVRERTIESFKKMLPPERAAQDILRGIKKNAPRVLVTREAYAIDWIKRALPDLSTTLVAKNWKRMPGI